MFLFYILFHFTTSNVIALLSTHKLSTHLVILYDGQKSSTWKFWNKITERTIQLFIKRVPITGEYSQSKSSYGIPVTSVETFDSLSWGHGAARALRRRAAASSPRCLMARCHFQVFPFCYCYTFFKLIPFVPVLFAL